MGHGMHKEIGKHRHKSTYQEQRADTQLSVSTSSRSILNVHGRGQWSVKMEKPKVGFPFDSLHESLVPTCSTNVRHVYLGTMLRPAMRVRVGGIGNQRSTSLYISTEMHHLIIHSFITCIRVGISADKAE
jgi:hypothetical protein